MTSFGWLHLTDLHMGMAQQPGLLPTIKALFFDDLKWLYEKSQPWDLVVFTGDLTQRANPEEFQRLDEFLNELWDTLRTFGCKPSLVAVPGNHDLVRPDAKSPVVKLLSNSWATDKEVRDEFWSNADSEYRKTIAAAFQNYSDWWERTQFKPAIKPGKLPGDFSAVIEKEGASLGIVGLNTSFLQLTSTAKEGTLALNPIQFHEVCSGDGPVWLKNHNACLLLTHHPPSWLNTPSREHLQQDIVGNNNFAVHLFGHMHETRYASESARGTPRIRVFQGISLFGLEEFGEEKKVSRRHGYSAGRIDLQGEEGVLTFWPRVAKNETGQWNFVVDSDSTFVVRGEETEGESFKLKKPFQSAAVSSVMNDNKQPEISFGKRWAVLIGINDYQHFTKLQYCRQDVIDLADKLRADLNFDEVVTIHEQADVLPDRDSILLTLGELGDAKKIGTDDLFLFYFAGHGINEGGKDYLLPIGAHPRHVKNLGIPVQEIVDQLSEFECKHTVMFIDACRDAVAGARGGPALGVETNEIVKKANICTFLSCGPADRSYEIDALGHGSFTYCILQAIKDGAVTTVAELDQFLVRSVPQVNRENKKPPQLPQTIMIPDASAAWPIFFNGRKPSASTGRYAELVEKLTELAANEKFAEEVFLGTIEFLGRISDNIELNPKEQRKLSAIKALCDGKWTPDIFSTTWKAFHRVRIATPQIKRPERSQ